jgi:hypothetical protein
MSIRSLALAVLVGSVAVACGSRTDLPGSGTTPATQNVPDASTPQEAGSLFDPAVGTSRDAMAEARSMVGEADAAACKLPAAIGTDGPCVVSLPPFNLCGPREYGLSCPGGGFQPTTAGGGGAVQWVPSTCGSRIPHLLGNGPLCCPCE